MESSQASGPAFPPPRRVFTAPASSLAPQPASSSQPSSGVVETLYDHPSAKIVAFTAGSRHYSLGGAGPSQIPDVAPGSLSWSSQLERTIAFGQFRIYRAPGSVAFLNCGSALQPILPKSQVWCVDEASSKFILQIRRPQYWRIEVPVATDEEVQRALLLRQVFDQILQFEKTECPFQRSFTVELPERPKTPVKKRPWTPAPRPTPALPPTPDHTPVELARVRRDVPKLEPIVVPETLESLSEPGKNSDQIVETQASPKTLPVLAETRTSEGELEAKGDEAQQPEVAAVSSQRLAKAPILGNTLPALRSVTAPPQLTLNASPPSKVREEGQPEPPRNASRSQSPVDSQSSFHSVASWSASSLPPSPPLSNPASPLGSSCPSEIEPEPLGQDDSPELASITNSSPTWSACPSSDFDSSLTAPSSVNGAVETSSTSSETAVEEDRPQTPHPAEETLENTCTSAISDSPLSETAAQVARRRPSIRRRGTTSSSISPSRRALSPLPSAANLFAPRRPLSRSPSKGTLDVVRRLPLAIIQTTCEILMSPPSHLINLMLKVAARITAGEWSGFVFGTDEHGERIPVHWDWSDDEDTERPSPYPALRKNSLGWLPITGQIMAGTFPESDDEDSDHHHENDIEITQTISNELATSTEIDRMGDYLHEPPTPTKPLDTTRSEDLSESLGVD
ncbi:Inheritance of peroxisomes protein 1 domain containing protein [Naviculisporaceae sp. PSN 640]